MVEMNSLIAQSPDDPFFHEQSVLTAKRTRQQDSATDRVSWVFWRLLQREPLAKERAIARQFLDAYPGSEDERWAAYARVLMASNEFIYVD